VKRFLFFALLIAACRKTSSVETPRPSILLITLDTTRADAVRPDVAPNFDAFAKRGVRFTQAYTPVPQTLAAHCSMMTGLYPAGHGVHENGRYLAQNVPLVAEQLKAAGYRTAAFVSAFALDRRFGLARGFDVYDDDFGQGRPERNAKETTDRVLEYLSKPSDRTSFIWVHYYDPHFPYMPPPPFRGYLGEVGFMDQQLGRLLAAFRGAVIIAGDHGEGLGEHGEAQHGDLLYQATMHVPLAMAGPGVSPMTSDAPVSTRRIFHTIRDWAGLDASHSLRKSEQEVVVGEAMKPYLDYGWQPQVMALEGRLKTISAGKIEVYDVIADPAETHNLAASASLSRSVRAAIQQYPLPSFAPPPADDESRKQLASLGYIASVTKPVIRKDAPRPADMAPLFPLLDEAAHLFVAERYREAIPILERILKADPHNLDSALRLATAESSLGRDAEAVAAFQRALAIDPTSEDVRTYLGLHYVRGKDWQRAIPLLEGVVKDDPDRVPAVEGLAVVRERQGLLADAVRLLRQAYAQRTPSSADLVHLGKLAMDLGDTATAIDAFERAHSDHDLELGVLYLAARRFEDARDALDRVPPASPDYAMALFKRAQVSVLLREPDAQSRIAAARAHATPLTRELIARERLFGGG
jgi:tetratricopeptide (TPR) repeat protein